MFSSSSSNSSSSSSSNSSSSSSSSSSNSSSSSRWVCPLELCKQDLMLLADLQMYMYDRECFDSYCRHGNFYCNLIFVVTRNHED